MQEEGTKSEWDGKRCVDTLQTHHTAQDYSKSLQNPICCYKAELALVCLAGGGLQAKMRAGGEAQKICKRIFVEMTFH